MHPKLLGNPLVAWRDDSTLQIGWGVHGLLVESPPASLPQWLRHITGSRSRTWLVSQAARQGIPEDEADSLLDRLAEAGLLGPRPPLRVSIAGSGLLHDPLAAALRGAGVEVVPHAPVVVFPQGQAPSLMAAPRNAGRLIPLWFEAQAVHVGPVVDEAAGPCPRCVELAWADTDARWSSLVAQAVSVSTWAHPAQIVQAAAAIALVGQSAHTVGLEMIVDPDRAGPCWRVWSVHPRCDCQGPR